MERLKNAELRVEEEKVEIVEISEKSPLVLLGAFPLKSEKPLFLSPNIPDAKIGVVYENDEKEYEKKNVSSFRDKFIFFDLKDLKEAFSVARFYKVLGWGKCFTSNKRVVVQKCKIIEKINLENINLHSSTASRVLLDRDDLTELEIKNCKSKIIKDYDIYTHIFFSRKFDFYLFKKIKDVNIISWIIKDLEEGNVKIENIDLLISEVEKKEEELNLRSDCLKEKANLFLFKFYLEDLEKLKKGEIK